MSATEPPPPPTAATRGRFDNLWFALLFASLLVGIGMTIFAPVGNETHALESPATQPAREGAP